MRVQEAVGADDFVQVDPLFEEIQMLPYCSVAASFVPSAEDTIVHQYARAVNGTPELCFQVTPLSVEKKSPTDGPKVTSFVPLADIEVAQTSLKLPRVLNTGSELEGKR